MSTMRLSKSRWLRLLPVAAVMAGLLAVAVVWWRGGSMVTIGVEGRRVIEIAGPEMHAAPFTPGDALSVRIAGVERTEKGLRYDLRFIAYGPGEHDLAGSLFLADRARP